VILHDIDELTGEIKRRSAATAPFIVALDGRSGTGKSTLAKELANRLEATAITQDDFYTGGALVDWNKLTAQQKADLVIDWRRVRQEALEPLRANRQAVWHPFNWTTLEGLAPYTIAAEPTKIVILDGAYAARPELSDLINLSVLVRLPDTVRRERLRHREGEDHVMAWQQVWDEAEDYYLAHMRPANSFDIV
jgi:uridine kinase